MQENRNDRNFRESTNIIQTLFSEYEFKITWNEYKVLCSVFIEAVAYELYLQLLDSCVV
jgi:hypothetical protein